MKIYLLMLLPLVFSHYTRENPSPYYKANSNTQYRIIGKYPRSGNLKFFTEGLTFHDANTLVESTGLYGDSEMHFIPNFEKGSESELKNRHQLDQTLFGEGCVKTNTGENGEEEYFQLTYKERKAFVYDKNLEKIKRSYDIPSEIQEGWGLTAYKNERGKDVLIVSDGSDKLFHVDPSDFSILKTLNIKTFQGDPLPQINELELYRGGSILANVFNINKIIKLNIEDGKLLQVYDFQGVVDDLESEDGMQGYVEPFFGSVLNGIAYHKESKRLVIGGKKWPYWYEIELNEQDA